METATDLYVNHI